MQVKYLVQNPHMTTAGTQATLPDGTKVAASINAFEVSLCALDGQNGGTVVRAVGAQVDEAKELFKNDAIVTATFAATEEKYEPK